MRHRLAAFVFCIFLLAGSSGAVAQVEFVQITDPHLFDAGDTADNFAELKSCVREINVLFSRGTRYQFAVLTGDVGIEKLVKGNPNEKAVDVKTRLKAGADQLAEVLATSQIKTWLFIPGNNDLIDERPDRIEPYQMFVKLLAAAPSVQQAQVGIVDLTPYLGYAASGVHREGKYAFLGFNNASFKSNGKAENKSLWELPYHHRELVEIGKRLDLVTNPTKPSGAARVKSSNKSLSPAAGTPVPAEHVYFFYHIPEVDDPYYLGVWRKDPQSKIVSDWMQQKGTVSDDPFRFSGWTVTHQVRQDWDRIVQHAAVKGLFTGHLHDQNRETYQNFDWLQNKNYSAVVEGKLFICPPIAAKRQTRPDIPQARGFRVISIADDGSVSSRIIWCTSDAAQPAPMLPQTKITFEK